MTTIVIIAVPSLLLTLALEVSEGRMSAWTAGLDGGVALLSAAAALRACGAI